jgi:predicted metal-binding membrane protein
VLATALTIVGCQAMSKIGSMAMPGGWAMSMTWMRMPGQSWTNAAAMFISMWIVMMVPMMLPSLMPMLSRYRERVAEAANDRLGRLTVTVALGYFTVWTGIGTAVFVLGAALASLLMASPALSRAVPIAVGACVAIAGAFQFTAWKVRQLACCRAAAINGCICRANVGSAWRHGLRLGLRCSACCSGPMMVLLIVGVMDLAVMAVVTIAITLERITPFGDRAARATGAIATMAGLGFVWRGIGCA